MTSELAWDKTTGLIPAIVQDVNDGKVLMLAYMNQAALQMTLETQYVTFFSRSKNRLWTKGETSGNKLKLISWHADCDQDTLLIIAEPLGPACHTNTTTCFGDTLPTHYNFLQHLEQVIKQRANTHAENSYTAKLLNSGLKRVAQKVGEEGVEVALAALVDDKQELCGEVADLFFHTLVLLRAKNIALSEIIDVLKSREKVGCK